MSNPTIPFGSGGIGPRSPPFGRPYATLRGVSYGAAWLRQAHGFWVFSNGPTCREPTKTGGSNGKQTTTTTHSFESYGGL